MVSARLVTPWLLMIDDSAGEDQAGAAGVGQAGDAAAAALGPPGG